MSGIYMEERPTRMQRLWRWLGFRERHIEAPEDAEGMAPGWMATITDAHVDWRDRLRVLVSGRVRVKSYTQTDVIVTTALTVSNFSVLAPGGK